MKTARRHHYLSQFHLSGFTDSGTRGGNLYLLDLQKGTICKSTPLNVANKRDYYRINAQGVDPSLVENHFAQIESRIAPIFREIRENKILPSGEKLNDLLFFISLMYLKTPRARTFMRTSHLGRTDQLARTALAQRNDLEELIREARAAGEIPQDYTFEKLKRSYLNGGICPAPNQNLEVSAILGLSLELFEWFIQRNWSLLIVPEHSPKFVVADSPVIEIRNTPQSSPVPSGLASRQVDLFVPLAKDMALLGVWRIIPSRQTAQEGMIHVCNSCSVEWAHRFVISANEEETCKLSHDKVGSIQNLAKLLAERNQNIETCQN